MNRVLIFAPMVGRGGVHRVVQRLSHGFAAYADPDEWHFTVLGQQYDEYHNPITWPADWPFIQVRPSAMFPAHPRQFQWLYSQRQTFYDHLEEFAPLFDLIYCPSAWWTMRVNHFCLPVPFVTSVPDFAFDFINMGELLNLNFRRVSRLIAEQTDFTVFSSHFQRLHGERNYGFKRTATIPHSADFIADHFNASPAETERVRARYKLPKSYVLAFHPMQHKGVKTVLRAIAWARRLNLDVPPLVLAGLHTDQVLDDEVEDQHIDQVRNMIAGLHLLHGVDFYALGRIPEADIGGLYAGAKCAVAASESEGDLSGTIFEAFMASTPLIYSDLPVFTERLGLGKQYGLCFPVNDYEALAQRIIEVCESPAAAAERAVRALEWTKQRSVRDVVAEYLDVFRFELGYVKGAGGE